MTYYRVLPHGHYGKWYKVEVWRIWWPFWVTAAKYLDSEQEAYEWIKGHSVYYDGAA